MYGTVHKDEYVMLPPARGDTERATLIPTESEPGRYAFLHRRKTRAMALVGVVGMMAMVAWGVSPGSSPHPDASITLPPMYTLTTVGEEQHTRPSNDVKAAEAAAQKALEDAAKREDYSLAATGEQYVGPADTKATEAAAAKAREDAAAASKRVEELRYAAAAAAEQDAKTNEEVTDKKGLQHTAEATSTDAKAAEARAIAAKPEAETTASAAAQAAQEAESALSKAQDVLKKAVAAAKEAPEGEGGQEARDAVVQATADQEKALAEYRAKKGFADDAAAMAADAKLEVGRATAARQAAEVAATAAAKATQDAIAAHTKAADAAAKALAAATAASDAQRAAAARASETQIAAGKAAAVAANPPSEPKKAERKE